LRRLRDHAQAFSIDIGRPIRRHRSDFFKEHTLRKAIQLARIQEDCRSILRVVDADDDCPKEWIHRLHTWARSEAGGVPCEIVMPNREYEAWFLASLESLREAAGIRAEVIAPPDPETTRDPKGALESMMIEGEYYLPTADQARLSAAFALDLAYRGSRSFRRMVSAFASLAEGMGVSLPQWPESLTR
jgi:hypothetical protein